MAVTLDQVYRDVNSLLGQAGIRETTFAPDDVINAINDSIATRRAEYVQQGLGHKFSTTEKLTPSSRPPGYPFLYSASMSDTIMQDLPIEFAVVHAFGERTDNTLTDTTTSFNKGDRAIKDDTDDLYECVETYSSTNTYDETFEAKQIKVYYPNSGTEFFTGDVVYDHKSGSYYEATSDYTNDTDTDIASTGSFKKLYWRKLGKAYVRAEPVPFSRLNKIQLDDTVPEYFPFSIKEQTLYSYTKDLPISVTYVPEWSWVTDRSTNLDIPTDMVQTVKFDAVTTLAQKLGADMEQIQQQLQQMTENEGE